MPVLNLMRSTYSAATMCCAFFGSILGVQAQDPHGQYGVGHDVLHHWYLTLKQPGNGASCCSNQECRPTQSRIVNGEVQVEVEGAWTTVSRSKVLNTPSPDLQSHVCASRSSYHIYCVVLGSGT